MPALVLILGLGLGLALVLAPSSSARGDIPPAPPPPPAPAPPASAVLSIRVTGVRSATGQVTALLFAGDGGFPAKEARALSRVSVPATVGEVNLRFAGIPPGSYAVTVYHDENGNGKLDTNWIGIPKEPVAVSNNAKGRMGPPKYKDAMFSVEGGDKSLQISLIKI